MRKNFLKLREFVARQYGINGLREDETTRLIDQFTPLVKCPFIEVHGKLLDVFQQYDRAHPELKTMIGSPPSIVYDYLDAKYAVARRAAAFDVTAHPHGASRRAFRPASVKAQRSALPFLKPYRSRS
jgi:hypothetical protein